MYNKAQENARRREKLNLKVEVRRAEADLVRARSNLEVAENAVRRAEERLKRKQEALLGGGSSDVR